MPQLVCHRYSFCRPTLCWAHESIFKLLAALRSHGTTQSGACARWHREDFVNVAVSSRQSCVAFRAQQGGCAAGASASPQRVVARNAHALAVPKSPIQSDFQAFTLSLWAPWRFECLRPRATFEYTALSGLLVKRGPAANVAAKALVMLDYAGSRCLVARIAACPVCVERSRPGSALSRAAPGTRARPLNKLRTSVWRA